MSPGKVHLRMRNRHAAAGCIRGASHVDNGIPDHLPAGPQAQSDAISIADPLSTLMLPARQRVAGNDEQQSRQGAAKRARFML